MIRTTTVLFICIIYLLVILSSSASNDAIEDSLWNSFENAQANAKEKLIKLFNTGIPQKVGYGYLVGYSSGFAVKKASKMLAFAVGSFFIAMQFLAHNGLIDVHYERIEKKVMDVLDLNGDGVIDGKDLQKAHSEFTEIVGYHMPSGGGFTAGVLMGLRS